MHDSAVHRKDRINIKLRGSRLQPFTIKVWSIIIVSAIVKTVAPVFVRVAWSIDAYAGKYNVVAWNFASSQLQYRSCWHSCAVEIQS